MSRDAIKVAQKIQNLEFKILLARCSQAEPSLAKPNLAKPS